MTPQLLSRDADHHLTPWPEYSPPPGLARSDQAVVLAEIMHEPVAVWDRPSPLDDALVARACARGLAIKSWVDTALLMPTLRRLLPAEDDAALREDLALLADMTACLFGVTGVGLRVTALEKPMCPRFHVDRIPVRLLCTYGGPGSEWLPAAAVPPGLLTPGASQEGAFPTDAVQRLAAGQVALFKGDTWDDTPGGGVVHRSPPVPAGTRRLLVTLDI